MYCVEIRIFSIVKCVSRMRCLSSCNCDMGSLPKVKWSFIPDILQLLYPSPNPELLVFSDFWSYGIDIVNTHSCLLAKHTGTFSWPHCSWLLQYSRSRAEDLLWFLLNPSLCRPISYTFRYNRPTTNKNVHCIKAEHGNTSIGSDNVHYALRILQM